MVNEMVKIKLEGVAYEVSSENNLSNYMIKEIVEDTFAFVRSLGYDTLPSSREDAAIKILEEVFQLYLLEDTEDEVIKF